MFAIVLESSAQFDFAPGKRHLRLPSNLANALAYSAGAASDEHPQSSNASAIRFGRCIRFSCSGRFTFVSSALKSFVHADQDRECRPDPSGFVVADMSYQAERARQTPSSAQWV